MRVIGAPLVILYRRPSMITVMAIVQSYARPLEENVPACLETGRPKIELIAFRNARSPFEWGRVHQHAPLTRPRHQREMLTDQKFISDSQDVSPTSRSALLFDSFLFLTQLGAIPSIDNRFRVDSISVL